MNKERFFPLVLVALSVLALMVGMIGGSGTVLGESRRPLPFNRLAPTGRRW